MPSLLAIAVGAIASGHVSAAGDSVAPVAVSTYQPRIQLIVPGYSSGQAWTAASVYRSPLCLTTEVAGPAVEQKTKAKQHHQRSKARKKKRNGKAKETATASKATHVAVPVTLLAWNLPCETGISSHKTASEQKIGIETDGSLDLTRGWVRFPESSARVVRGIQAFEKFSLFADVTCASDQQSGPARILSCSKDTNERNFTLGQQGDAFIFRVRTSQQDSNGTHREVTFGKVVAGQRQQVSVQYNGCTLSCSVDGTVVAEHKLEIDFSSWQQFAVQAGNEATGDRPWAGHLHGLLMLPEVDYCHEKLNCQCKDSES